MGTKIKDADGVTRYIKSTGSGTEIDGYIPEHTISGTVDVAIQDQTSVVVDVYADKRITGTYAVNTLSVIDTRTVIIDSTVLPVVGNTICLKQDLRYFQAVILSFTGANPYTLTIDTPLDYAFTAAAEVYLSTKNMNVNGSVTTQIFDISPPTGVKWDITRLIMHMEDDIIMDSSKFGGLAALSRGVVFRKKDGEYFNFFNVKTNGEIAERCYDVEYDPKAPAGVYGFRARSSFAGQDKRGVVIRLDGTIGDEFQILIQDDLSALSKFRVVIQGHVVIN